MNQSSTLSKSAVFVVAAVTASVLVWVLIRARKDSADPARCPPMFEAFLHRCCPQGQHEAEKRCVGRITECPKDFDLIEDSCVAYPLRARLLPGYLHIGPGDWEAQGVVTPREINVRKGVEIDIFEVTQERYNRCVQDGACAANDAWGELGLPVRRVNFQEARRFCAWAGGDLPREQEWILAASGAQGRRYPWGDTGAVCRRASWGLVDGPCVRGGSGPELAGLHIDDRTAEGFRDLAGNVAEWVVDDTGGALVKGGSFRSALAAELRTWRTQRRDPNGRYDDIGFRCHYEGGSVEALEVLPSKHP